MCSAGNIITKKLHKFPPQNPCCKNHVTVHTTGKFAGERLEPHAADCYPQHALVVRDVQPTARAVLLHTQRKTEEVRAVGRNSQWWRVSLAPTHPPDIALTFPPTLCVNKNRKSKQRLCLWTSVIISYFPLFTHSMITYIFISTTTCVLRRIFYLDIPCDAVYK